MIEASDRARKGVQMTEKKQGVSAWLRGIVDESYGKESRPLCTGITETFFGIKCRQMHTCGSCILEMFTEIAYRIDAERSLPEGIEWPRFEDGELVKVGDEVEFEGETTRVCFASFNAECWSLWCEREGFEGRLRGSFGEAVKRPTPKVPKVLDADGAPIKVGDVVYFVADKGEPALTVECIDVSGEKPVVDLVYSDNRGSWHLVNPEKLTHERPDSWEKLEKDAMGRACELAGSGHLRCGDCEWSKEGIGCQAMARLEILKRAKKLAGIEEEAQR